MQQHVQTKDKTVLETNWKGYRTAAWFGQLLLAGAIVFVLIQRQWFAAASLTGFLLVSLAFLKLERKLPRLFDLLFVIAALINAGGWAWDWFNKPGLYDEVAHSYTLFAITLAIGFLLFDRLFASFYDHRVLFIVIIACLGISIGAWWEVVEWVADFFTPKQIVSGIDDTITDLMLDSAGALLAACANIYVLNERSRSELAEEQAKKAHEQPAEAGLAPKQLTQP